MFAHLHCHSNFSLLRGACTVDELAAGAKARGMTALAITDANGMFGAVPFYQACLEHGIKAILGVELVLADAKNRQQSAVFLARNRDGYSELCRLVTARHLAEEFDLIAAIRDASADLIVLTADPDLILAARGDGEKFELGERARVYLELHPAESPVDAKRRDKLARWAGRNLVPVVATNDVHFLNPHQRAIHQVLRAIDENTSVSSMDDDEFVDAGCWLKPPDRMAGDLGPWQEALTNAAAIADECNVDLQLGTLRFPTFDVPYGKTAGEYLREVTYHGADEKYGTLASVVRSRVDYELETIIDMGFADYFLIVWDIVEEAKRRGVPIVGRGSAADSIVAYVLDMTRVDPVEHNLYFERFLNYQRKDPPDVDLDFCWRRRDEMLQYVFEKYGEDRVAMISTHNTFGVRSAIREIARAQGLSPGEVNRVAARLPYGSVERIEQAVATRPEYRDLPIHREPLKSILEIARAIDGYPRHLSVHAGGLVIAPDKLTNYVPLQNAAKGVIITQYDMHPIEDLGLVKMDLLGQRSLSVIADTVDAVKEHYDIEIDIEHIPQDDEPTQELFRQGATMGCFQVESPGMRQLLQKLRADDFEIITAASSVIRPGPADSGMMASFIRRHIGKEQVTYVHPKLEPLLKETYGVMLYQEDVLKVASAIGGMSLGEADNLRRSMTKKRGFEGIKDERDRFLQGAVRNNIPTEAAEEIWRQIESFSGYAFCKAHSASYARLSWQAGYLKAHYPAEFMAAVLSNQGGFYSPAAYVEEARRIGLRILSPSISRSKYFYTAENDGGSGTDRRPYHARDARGAMRIGLMQVKSLTTRAIRTIIDERQRRPFDSLDDFLMRVPISLKECENLIECGAMDDFAGNRPQLQWRLHLIYGGIRKRKKSPAGTGSLLEGAVTTDVEIPSIADHTLAERLDFERRILDLWVSAHPMELYADVYRRARWVTVAETSEYIGRIITIAGIPITSKGTVTNKGEYMRFVSLEDYTGTIEIVFFPDVYSRCARDLDAWPMAVTGRITEDEGTITMEAQAVRPVE